MCPGDETGNIEKFDRYGAAALNTGAIIGFTAVGEAESCAGTFYLEIANGSLWVDRCEAGRVSGRILWKDKD